MKVPRVVPDRKRRRCHVCGEKWPLNLFGTGRETYRCAHCSVGEARVWHSYGKSLERKYDVKTEEYLRP
jgi:hypothetical protein